MRFTVKNKEVVPVFVALGYCPSTYTGQCYDTAIIAVFMSSGGFERLKSQEWFDPEEIPQAVEWYREMEEYHFPMGKDQTKQWSEEQLEIYETFEKAERKVTMWANNDISEELHPEFEMSSMTPSDFVEFQKCLALRRQLL